MINKTVLIIFLTLLVTNLGLGFYYLYYIYLPQKYSLPSVPQGQPALDWTEAKNKILVNCRLNSLSDNQERTTYVSKVQSTKTVEQKRQSSFLSLMGIDNNEYTENTSFQKCWVVIMGNKNGEAEISYETLDGGAETIRVKNFPINSTTQ